MPVSESASIRLVFVTMLRPESARRMIDSVRRFHPHLPITFAEQAEPPGDLQDLEGEACRILLPFDLGLAASRNQLIDSIEEDFFILGDDDFYVVSPLKLTTAVSFLRANPDVVFLGGHVTDYFYSDDQEPRCVDFRRESNIAIDTTGNGVVLIPRTYVGGEVRTHEGVSFERCDYVANWGIGRTSFFRESGFRWSDQLKIGHEHLDFFLRLKMQFPEKRVFFWRGLSVDHHRHREGSDRYTSYRQRDEFIEAFGRQAGLDYLCDPVIGRVQFFDDFRTQILFPRPDRERAARDRARLMEIRERYLKLKASFAVLRNSHLALKSSKAKRSSPAALSEEP